MSPLSAFTILLSVIIVCLTVSNVATIWYKVKVLEKSKDVEEFKETIKAPAKPKNEIKDPDEEIQQELY